MTPIGIVLNFLLSAILSTFILSDRVTVLDFAAIMLIYAAIMYAVNWLTFSTDFGRRIFVGTPRVLIKNGVYDTKQMKRMKLNVRDIALALRQHEIYSLRDVAMAQIEPNGELTIVKKGERDYSTVLIDNGVVDSAALEKIGKNHQWLMRRLAAKNITDPEQVFFAQWYKNKLQIIKKS